MAERVDLAIIGGGCAGLSLARRLASGGYGGRAVVIEPRAAYHDDRSWCFWSRNPHPLASASWSRWRFSRDDGTALVHHSEKWRYQYVRSADFYADAAQRIAVSRGVELRLGSSCSHVSPHCGGLRLETCAGPIDAEAVVDTRPPERRAGAQLHQCFLGVEIEDEGAFDPSCAGLMENMKRGPHGFEFTYLLPVSQDRAVVEHTVFSTRAVAPDRLRRSLQATLKGLGLERSRELRREGAILPMGVMEAPAEAPPGLVRAGAGAGAMRPATGYAFRRIEAWAGLCAQSLIEGGAPIGEAGRSDAAGWFDSVFLRALSRDGAPAPDWFFSMAKGLGADGFAHFMSDEARARDYGAVLTSLPPAPFIAAALRAA
ncbi:MAG: lycopene cyclase family protein [Oceanicaulis sp.]